MALKKVRPFGCGIMFKWGMQSVWRENVVGTRYECKESLIMLDSQSCDCDACSNVLILLAQHVKNGDHLPIGNYIQPNRMYRLKFNDIIVDEFTGEITKLKLRFVRKLPL